MKRILIGLFILTLLPACGTSNAIAPTSTIVNALPTPPFDVPTQPETPTPDATPASEPTKPPEPTATPTETPTPEVKQFPVCQIENFRDCPITVDDLFNGNYLAWLNTLSKPFDQSKIKQVPMEVMYGGLIVYDTKTAPNFRDPATAPFRRDVTAGYASYQGIDYIVMPVEYFDPKHPDKNQWVITVYSMYWPGHNQESVNKKTPLFIDPWRKYMKTTPIYNNDINDQQAEDPLVKMTFDNNPDMAERFGRFISGEDMGALSKPGIVVLNLMTIPNGHWLE